MQSLSLSGAYFILQRSSERECIRNSSVFCEAVKLFMCLKERRRIHTVQLMDQSYETVEDVEPVLQVRLTKAVQKPEVIAVSLHIRSILFLFSYLGQHQFLKLAVIPTCTLSLARPPTYHPCLPGRILCAGQRNDMLHAVCKRCTLTD